MTEFIHIKSNKSARAEGEDFGTCLGVSGNRLERKLLPIIYPNNSLTFGGYSGQKALRSMVKNRSYDGADT